MALNRKKNIKVITHQLVRQNLKNYLVSYFGQFLYNNYCEKLAVFIYILTEFRNQYIFRRYCVEIVMHTFFIDMDNVV